MGDHLFVQRSPDDIEKNGIARRDYNRQPDRPGDQLGKLAEQAQPFPDNDRKSDYAEQNPEEDQHRPGEVLRNSALIDGVFRLANRISCFSYSVLNGSKLDLVSIELDHRFFAYQKYVDRSNPGQGGDRFLHVHGAFLAIHAPDGDFHYRHRIHRSILVNALN